MKYLITSIMLLSFSTINIYGYEDVCDSDDIIIIKNLSYEQERDIIKLKEETLESFNNIREKIIAVRVETQMEMRKEEPDWATIKKLDMEHARLKKELNNEIIEYKEKFENIQGEKMPN